MILDSTIAAVAKLPLITWAFFDGGGGWLPLSLQKMLLNIEVGQKTLHRLVPH